MSAPDLSIIIITWKMRAMLESLLDSIYTYTKDIQYEIVVVDNHSQDGTVEMLKRRFPNVRLIENEENRGVAFARNQAFRVATGRYVLTLDADMQLVENSLAQLVRFMDQTPDAGLCGCKLIFPDETVQPSGRRFPTPMAFLLRRLDFIPFLRNSKTLRNHEMADWDRSDTRTVDYVIGACQMIRREALQQVGLLDESIFYGPEDVDYCLRMYHHGWRVYYVADTRIIHFEQRLTKKKLFSKLTWLHLKGVWYLFQKYRWRLSRDYHAERSVVPPNT
jgi:N-acetylglucosaminyl-diphospho-decaprenol L-rhamnosyltransferase